MPIRAIFSQGVNTLTVSGLHQWDYGQKLEIHGLGLPAMIEVHFACLNMTEAHVRIGTTADGVTTVAIPDGCLEHDTPLRAWVYVVDATSGKTERTIMLPIQARTKPQGAESRQPFEGDEYAAAIEQINTTVDNWRDGIVDQNDGGKTKVWTGTRAEFNGLEETDDHTLYVITDELPDYTDLVELYEGLTKGTITIPKAKAATEDNQGRKLNVFGYFGDVFQQIQNLQQLTEAGVYQMYVTAPAGSGYTRIDWLPLLCFDPDNPHVQNIKTDSLWVSVVSITEAGEVQLMGVEGAELGRLYARRIAPFSGWAVG